MDMPTPALDELDKVIAEMQALRGLAPVDRARAARNLSRRARTALGNAGNEAVFQVVNSPLRPGDPTRMTGQIHAADRIGVAQPTVNKACMSYRTLFGGPVDGAERAA